MAEEIVVIGSMNMDLVVETDTVPQKGETVLGNEFHQIPGGKGANQALAAGKLGGKVNFIGACGKDNYGDTLLSNLKKEGVNVKNVHRVNENTGIASITIEKDGDNRIIVVPGANHSLTPNSISEHKEIIKKASVLLLQLEIPINTVEKAVNLADEFNTTIILDPAPAQKLKSAIYKKIDYLLPNQGELDNLLNDNSMSINKKINKLLDMGVKNLVLTKGKTGITVYNKNETKNYETLNVKTVDTTAAGDAFAGALAYGLQKKWDENKIYKFANKVAAISVTKIGAQSSLPTIKEVKSFSKKEV